MKYLICYFYLCVACWLVIVSYWIGCKWIVTKERFERWLLGPVAIEPRVPKANEEIIEYRKNGHSYYFIFTPENTEGAMRLAGVLAADPQCDFGWNDAAKVAKAIKGACCEQVHVSV